MPLTLYIIGVILILFTLNIQSATYNTFTYDDGVGDDEHCCLVQIDEKFCLAKPLTSSLVQVKKVCQHLDANEKNKDYLNKVVRRINVDSINKIGGKILLELQTPLEKEILENDLVCLSDENNNINLEKCVIQLPANKQIKKKIGDDEAADESAANEKSDDDGKVRQVDISAPVKIRSGRGLSVIETHELDLSDCELTTRQERQCWSWYRQHTKEICSNPTKCQKNCIEISDEHEKCLYELLKRKAPESQSETYSLPVGSKLYCENNNEQTKLLGYHHHTKLCFHTNHQISIEYRFTDHVSLSDKKKNKDVLRFIANNTKLADEFESDCKDKTTLVDIRQALKKEADEAAEAATTADNSATDANPSTEE